MGKNKEEELKAEESDQKHSSLTMLYSGIGALFLMVLGAAFMPHGLDTPISVLEALAKGTLLFVTGAGLAYASSYIPAILRKHGIKRAPRAILKDIKRVDVKYKKGVITIQIEDKKQGKSEAPLSEAKANELKDAYSNSEVKNQDNNHPSNTAKEDKRIRTSQP